VYKSTTLKVPEKVIKDRIRRILIRMKKEGYLKVSDPVSTIMGKLFPSPGVIDETEFKRIVDVSNRKRIYKSVLDAQTKVKSGDKPKLETAFKNAANLAKDSGGDTTKRKLVFGSKHADAKTIYDKIASALDNTRTRRRAGRGHRPERGVARQKGQDASGRRNQRPCRNGRPEVCPQGAGRRREAAREIPVEDRLVPEAELQKALVAVSERDSADPWLGVEPVGAGEGVVVRSEHPGESARGERA
jgi:hypothetical protein